MSETEIPLLEWPTKGPRALVVHGVLSGLFLSLQQLQALNDQQAFVLAEEVERRPPRDFIATSVHASAPDWATWRTNPRATAKVLLLM